MPCAACCVPLQHHKTHLIRPLHPSNRPAIPAGFQQRNRHITTFAQAMPIPQIKTDSSHQQEAEEGSSAGADRGFDHGRCSEFGGCGGMLRGLPACSLCNARC
eukprot:1533945-Rhodomonas_salina.4